MKTGTGKSRPRPTRLVRFTVEGLDASPGYRDEGGIVLEDHFVANIVGESSDTVASDMLPLSTGTTQTTVPLGEAGAQQLLRRTPISYLLNQLYGLWVFASLFILSLIMTRKVPVDQYGVYAIAATAYNTIAYIVAFGFEDATNTYVPRVLAEHGLASAAHLIRRMFALRIVILAASLGIMLFALPYVAVIFAAIPLPTFRDLAQQLRSPVLLNHIAPIAFWVLGNGISSLLIAVYASIMRMRIVFIVGSLAQLFLLVVSFITLRLGLGIDSVLWLQAIATLLSAAAFAVWQWPLIFTRGAEYKQPLRPVLRLGISAWVPNLVMGALLKQVSINLLIFFAVSVTQIAFFTLSFQLADAANQLLVSGFGGVGIAALAAAFVGRNHQRLARTWQTLIKFETLLAAPVLIFSLFNSQAIALALYPAEYGIVGQLLGIFIFFNIIVRLLGSTIHQSTLYVLQKPQLVVLSWLLGLASLILLGILLIPHYGPAGALIADGISKIVTGGLMLAFIWRDLPEKY
ncbi:MAG TPA: polysaccharide biosynthesis C-terminal domain-containing protein, partial [Ktedonobacteraceae bacterium]|nr:polysaccharide biosynthesis C-terminal domain-containing protein [Ktedonobacteraceae bacterium]